MSDVFYRQYDEMKVRERIETMQRRLNEEIESGNSSLIRHFSERLTHYVSKYLEMKNE